MNASGEVVRMKIGRRWDEIRLSYLSWQLHVVDFHLSWQKGMWGSPDLVFIDYLYLSGFLIISPFQSPGEVWEYWLQLLQNMETNPKLKAEKLNMNKNDREPVHVIGLAMWEMNKRWLMVAELKTNLDEV